MSGAEYLRRSTLFNQSIPSGSQPERLAAAARLISDDPDPINFFLGIIWMDAHGFGDKSTLELTEYIDWTRFNI